MTKFRPCIDLHNGQVKQIVGGTLTDEGASENHVSEHAPAWFAKRYRADGLTGGHVIKLGPGNDAAAREALAAWPNGLQLGGGITPENAAEWLDAGAEKLIVTSFLFDGAAFSHERLATLVKAVGPERLVLDLSCRRDQRDHRDEEENPAWTVATNRWQTRTDLPVTHAVLDQLADRCSEFLVHAADVEGLCKGIDSELVRLLGAWGKIPVTYAGGAHAFEDLALVQELSGSRVDLTIGSALDMFGGSIAYTDCVAWNQRS